MESPLKGRPKSFVQIFIIKWLRTATGQQGDRATGRQRATPPMSDGRRQHDDGWVGISVARAAATCEHFPICWILGSKTICDLQKVQTTRLVKGDGVLWPAPGRIARCPGVCHSAATRHENDLWQSRASDACPSNAIIAACGVTQPKGARGRLIGVLTVSHLSLKCKVF